MYLAIALKNWKFIVMAALAIALAFSVTSCTSKSHQIDLLESQKTLAETQRDLARVESAAASIETEKLWAQQLLESEQNANKKIQAALVAASDSALSIDRLSKQINESNKRMPTASSEALIEYGKTCNSILNTMAERGGTIAAAADGHAIDAEKLETAWPKQLSLDKSS